MYYEVIHCVYVKWLLFSGRERETTSPGYIHRDVDARATTQQSSMSFFIFLFFLLIAYALY